MGKASTCDGRQIFLETHHPQLAVLEENASRGVLPAAYMVFSEVMLVA